MQVSRKEYDSNIVKQGGTADIKSVFVPDRIVFLSGIFYFAITGKEMNL